MLTLPLTIARTTFIEAVRQPIYFVLLMLAALASVMTVWSTGYAMDYSSSAEVSSDNKLLLDIGMSSIFVIGTLLAGFVATSAISREIENKTVLTIVSKPVPRPMLVIGKWLGVTGAVLLAVIGMVCMLLLGIRHGVMSNASDELNMPVIIFGVGSLALALIVGVWGNFFYGWNFAQTTCLILCPLLVVAYLLVLFVGPHWDIEPLAKNFKPQILTACFCLGLALMVSTAIAVALSCRLGQVMTIVLCFVLLLLGLLSNALIGSKAHQNTPVAEVLSAEPADRLAEGLKQFGNQYKVVLKAGGARELRPGMPFYYGPSPNGMGLQVPGFAPKPDLVSVESLARGEKDAPGGLFVVKAEQGNIIYVQNTWRDGTAPERGPRAGDFVFIETTRTNMAALVAWGLVPNLQSFWLLDAVTQNQAVPASHLALIVLYALAQVTVALSLAVLLFQERDVG